MNTDAMISTLKSLKLFGMADTITNMAEQASPVYQQAVPILETLLKAEVAERDVRSINGDAANFLDRFTSLTPSLHGTRWD
ncbi:hypothetical protein [Sedimenticola selenatireducens]|uniref:hypothetical protein n=1 Tax=Sedimenticola selenatireducens TaxID=191960 RepID=UPI0016434C79